jgi:hypothetical protein
MPYRNSEDAVLCLTVTPFVPSDVFVCAQHPLTSIAQMAIQLTAAAYQDFQNFSTKKALDAKDAHNIDGKSTRIAYIVYSIEKEAITTEKLGYGLKVGTSEADMKADMANHEEVRPVASRVPSRSHV